MKKILKKIVLPLVICVCGGMVLSACNKPSDPIKLNKVLQERVIRKALSAKFGHSNLEIIPYSFNLNVKGDVSYEENIKADLDVNLKGQNAINVSSLSSSSATSVRDLSVLGVKGSVAIKGQVSAMGIIFNIDEHFNF